MFVCTELDYSLLVSGLGFNVDSWCKLAFWRGQLLQDCHLFILHTKAGILCMGQCTWSCIVIWHEMQAGLASITSKLDALFGCSLPELALSLLSVLFPVSFLSKVIQKLSERIFSCIVVNCGNEFTFVMMFESEFITTVLMHQWLQNNMAMHAESQICVWIKP